VLYPRWRIPLVHHRRGRPRALSRRSAKFHLVGATTRAGATNPLRDRFGIPGGNLHRGGGKIVTAVPRLKVDDAGRRHEIRRRAAPRASPAGCGGYAFPPADAARSIADRRSRLSAWKSMRRSRAWTRIQTIADEYGGGRSEWRQCGCAVGATHAIGTSSRPFLIQAVSARPRGRLTSHASHLGLAEPRAIPRSSDVGSEDE